MIQRALLITLVTLAVHAEDLAERLDAAAKTKISEERVVGASVLVELHNRIVLHKGYGFADLGLEAPTKPETVYHVVGPMMPVTGVAILQLVERGKLSLEDDLSKFVPEFPEQGHHVTIRHLLNHTSGIVDYHYLGDPIDATSRQPKALDEVMALYSNKRWVNEPGSKWDWSISGFQLLVTILERVTGQSYADYVQQNILTPAEVKSTTYCDDFTLTPALAHGYRIFGAGFVMAQENDMAFNTDLRYCSSVGDLHRIWNAVKKKPLIQPATLKMMSTAVGPAEHMSAVDPKMHYGLALTLNHEEDHRSVGQHGSLLGYSGCLYDFPEDELTVVVLTNTENQNAYAIAKALARVALRLPELPKPAALPDPLITGDAVSRDEGKQLTGTFVLSAVKVPANLHDSFAQYRRTYRVFDENGRLMIQPLGEGPQRLLRQPDGSFAMATAPKTHISFVLRDGHATRMAMDSPGGLGLAGDRAGDGDPRTFHQQR
ncbi:MAG TPA: serine hydrolase domain-containing protein [Bryobacteraceae bacterium]|nr:serine hydrolase domain-containing protein [Bryobacteraceae bacterium]